MKVACSKTVAVVAGTLAMMVASIAAGQAPNLVRVRATIDRVEGQMLDVKGRDGAMMKVQLAPNAPVNEVVKASLSDIKKGDYIAVTAMPQPDGSQKAVAILIFPEALRGVAEGFRPWDLSPQSTMTNATVANQVTSADGQKLTAAHHPAAPCSTSWRRWATTTSSPGCIIQTPTTMVLAPPGSPVPAGSPPVAGFSSIRGLPWRIARITSVPVILIRFWS